MHLSILGAAAGDAATGPDALAQLPLDDSLGLDRRLLQPRQPTVERATATCDDAIRGTLKASRYGIQRPGVAGIIRIQCNRKTSWQQAGAKGKDGKAK